MPLNAHYASAFKNLDSFLEDISLTKAAKLQKGAEANTEKTVDQSTATPTKDVDDGTQPASEGAQSAANSRTIKELIPGSIEDGIPPGPEAKTILPEGFKASPTGEAPQTEKKYESTTKDTDEGTSTPATVSDGEKYGSMSRAQLADLMGKRANDVLTKMTARNLNGAKSAQAQPPAPASAPAAAPAPVDPVKAAFAEHVHAACADIIKNAWVDADDVAALLQHEVRIKRAEEEEEAKKKEDGASEKKSDPPSPEGEGGNGPIGGSPADDAGGAGGDPAALASMMGGGDASGGGGMTDEAAINELLNALKENGMTVEDAIALLHAIGSGGMGGAGGGMGGDMGGAPPADPTGGMGAAAPTPPMPAAPDATGGAPPMAPPGPPDPTKMGRLDERQQLLYGLLKQAQAFRNSYRFQATEPKTAQQKQLRAAVRANLKDILKAR